MKETMHSKPIGIIGGMGPDASVRLYGQMIGMARDEFKAKENHEYPEIVLQSVPVPEFFSNTKRMEEALTMLKDRVEKISEQPLSCIGVACNTAHVVLADLEEVTETPFVSIPEEVAREAEKKGFKKVGLLASPTTILSGVYRIEFLNKNIEIELPDNGDIEAIGEIIGEVVAGEFKHAEVKLLMIADLLKEKKVEAIVLGCTELPLVFPKDYSLPILDSVDILARSLLTRYYQREEI